MKPTPTVYIVDDDPSLRRVLRELFELEQLPVETFGTVQAFLDGYQPQGPGCLLLDVRMPRTSGLELQDQLAERGIDLPVIFMTAYADVSMSVRAMKAGAVDFLEKPFNEQRLLEAVHQALAGDQAARQESGDVDALQRRFKGLTFRERQVLEQVVAGKTNGEIAAAWDISEKTIKVHRGRVMEKMGANSLAQLVLIAQKIGIPTTKVV
jgi:FixJ family two-component response regulator